MVVVVPYPVSVGQCFLQRSNKSITLTGIFLSNERLGVDERIPCCLGLYPVPTHDFLISKFWMPKVCKRGRTLPMLVRSSPNACCCQWMAAMAHTALPTERCASVWKCGCQRLFTKMWLSSSVICERWRKKSPAFYFPCVLIAKFFPFFKENCNKISNKISGPTIRFTFSLCFFCGKLPTTRHWLWRHFLRSRQWSGWKGTSEFWRIWISGSLFKSSLVVMTSWNIMKCKL